MFVKGLTVLRNRRGVSTFLNENFCLLHKSYVCYIQKCDVSSIPMLLLPFKMVYSVSVMSVLMYQLRSILVG